MDIALVLFNTASYLLMAGIGAYFKWKNVSEWHVWIIICIMLVAGPVLDVILMGTHPIEYYAVASAIEVLFVIVGYFVYSKVVKE